MKIQRASILIKFVKNIIKDHKRKLVLGVLALILLTVIAVVAAAVYNSMHLQSTVCVE